MALRRPAMVTAAFVLASLTATPAAAHQYDHPVPSFAQPAPLSSAFNAGGDGADWELLTTIATGNPHTDIDFFTSGGETYAAVGTLAVGPNGGGVTIIQLTADGEVDPQLAAAHPSASCLSHPAAALGLQHDVEATPKGEVLLNTDFVGLADRRDAQLVIDATDAEGRCHDQGILGLDSAPLGGLEIIDVTDPTSPVEIGLTSHIGEAHTVNIDPKRPHIAYAVSSDSVGVTFDEESGEYVRNNETSGYSLDGFEIVDLSSCMDFPEGTTVQEKRDACRPQVHRYRYPDVAMALGHTNPTQVHGCHELELYPDDRLTCAAGDSLIVLDMADAFDDNGTPDDFTDDTVRGEPLPCRVRESSSELIFFTGAMITDCVVGEGDQDLRVSGWLAAGAPGVEGVEWVGTAYHMGREALVGSATEPAYPALEDIDFNHEAELTHSGKFLIATDERGGGVAPGGASCSPGFDIEHGNGGIHAFRVDGLKTSRPESAEEAWESYARTPSGDKAVIRAPINTQPQGTECTAHVFQQIPGQNRVFMGWYSQGTQVFDYVEHPDGTFEWRHVGWFTPEYANTWVSAVFRVDENQDGSFTYYGATGDFNVGNGRSAVDVYRVTLPPPAQTLVDAGEPLPPPAPAPTGDPGSSGEPAPAPPGDSALPATGGGAGLASLALTLLGLAGMATTRLRPRRGAG
jgi:hypothetical protein